MISNGAALHNLVCGRCHRFVIGFLPDLPRRSRALQKIYDRIVLISVYQRKVMAR